MPIFLTKDQIYRVLQRENPEDVYPDGAPSAFFSTADNYATAGILDDAYSNDQVIYQNMFPQTTVEQIAQWEVKVFGSVQDSSLSLDERVARVLSQIRSQQTMSLWSILTAILPYFPEGTPVQIWEWYKMTQDGGWQLGVSRLGFDTYLGGITRFIGPPGFDYCNPDYGKVWLLGIGKLGINTYIGPDPDAIVTSAAFAQAQMQAYAYTVRVFGYTMSAMLRQQVDSKLQMIEPARSYHFIFDNQNLSNYGLVYNKTDVSQSDNLDCLYVDPGSTTGYSGWSANP